MNLLGQPWLTFSKAAQQLRVHISTIHRYRLRGIRGVRLKTYLLGGKRIVLLADLNTFLAELNGTQVLPQALADRAAAAGKVLDAMGVRMERVERKSNEPGID